VDGKLLCQGCAAVELRRKAAKKGPDTPSGGAQRKPQPNELFDFWDGDLAPREDVHPLQQPLPNSVWEKFNKHKALLGNERAFRSDHLREAEEHGEAAAGDSEPYDHQQETPRQTRLRLWRRKKRSSLQGKTAAEEVPPHPSNMSTEQIKQHLMAGHGFNQHHVDLFENNHQDLANLHQKSHDDNKYLDYLDHTHQKSELPHPEGVEGIAEHLTKHHPIADWEVDLLKGDHDALKDTHDQFHENSAYSGSDAPKHTHPEGVAEKETVGHSHGSMTPEEMSQHILDSHGIKPKGLEMIQSGYMSGETETGSPTSHMEEWHNNHHKSGLPGASDPAHDHGGPVSASEPEGPEKVKNPALYSNSGLHNHLLVDHGINPDHLENAINGTFEATDPSHVVAMLHNKAHAEGQHEFAHEHEHYTGGPKISPAHQDHGTPFWGAPPSDVQKMFNHLNDPVSQGGHGLSAGDLNTHMDPVKKKLGLTDLFKDEDLHKVYEQVHDNIHGDGGASVGHQHVPTIHPGVMSPEKLKKEQLKQHLTEHHGWDGYGSPQMAHAEAHDPESYGYKGHPGHEHASGDPDGPVVQSLPSASHAQHYEHGSTMSKKDLQTHLMVHHVGKGTNSELPMLHKFKLHAENASKSHDELIQQHALMHGSGETDGHGHEPVEQSNPLEDVNAHYGTEPEIQTDTHPAVTNDHEALAHIIKHHPNVNQSDYMDWSKGNNTGKKPSMVAYHEALHTPGSKTSMGNTLPKVLDGHDHAEESGPPTQISVGSHLVHEHGMSQAEVASMTPAEFKAHHEKLHLKKSELDIGHGHIHPGGPMRDPRVLLPNTHHSEMRDDDTHPAVKEWYHGTGASFDGPPKNATELKDEEGFWGNFGAGDWNNHVGTHWTSLHQMARHFNNGGNRVIHAKLHIKNPITYNSLNHMAHDAYERLRASGHLQDGGHYHNNHADDSGYNHCCSDTLLEYAKGHHRDDGKFGLEAYRDSLRASGYDGIHVRNQADHPHGHWNAIPLSADQIEITHGGCRGEHGDERDDDVSEFNSNKGRLTRGWEHPKHYSPDQYLGKRLDHLPEDDEVKEANRAKRDEPQSNKTAVGRGDKDRYLPDGEAFSGDDDDETHYCDHCEEEVSHTTEDCPDKWCDVCEEYGSHTKDDGTHDYCDHCDDYADHSSGDCEENPDNWSKEAYCPHCDEKHKDNAHSEECVSCGEKLPEWGKLQSFGKSVKPQDYDSNGETSGASYGLRSEAKLQDHKNGAELAAHLYHHHKSDVGGSEFDDDGSWDEDALKNHHQWLHLNPKEAKSRGFEVDHDHKQVFGQFKKEMTPEETHAHLLLSHAGTAGGVGSLHIGDIAKMTPEEAVEAHKKAHDADNAVKWGSKDYDGDLIHKIKHSHDMEGEQASFDEAHYPKGEDLLDHMADAKYHGIGAAKGSLKGLFEKHPGVAEALHSQCHKSFGPSTEGAPKFHVHGPELDKQIAEHKAVHDHLVNDHGADPTSYAFKQASGKTEDLMKLHHQEHSSYIKSFSDPEHKHFGGTAHQDPSGHSAETMKDAPSASSQIIQHLKEHHGATDDDLAWHKNKVQKLINFHAQEHQGAPKLDLPKHTHEGLLNGQQNFPETHTNGGMSEKSDPHPKEASRRTLTDLFEEVAS
jgi:hypothetical protein